MCPELPAADLGVDLERFKRWKPDAQARALDRIRQAELNDWKPFYCLNWNCNGQPHVWPVDSRPCPNPYGHEWRHLGVWCCLNEKGEEDARHCGVRGEAIDDWLFPHARADQRPPRWKDDWLTLFMRGGRGSGKTRTGAEITRQVTKAVPRITLIAPTGPDFRAVMVEGDSGILATSPPGEAPEWEPSKKQLTWPNGAIALGYSAEEPDRLRGQNSGFVWADEPAHWPLVKPCWDNMLFGLRKGDYPKIAVTSTPKPIPWVKEVLADEYTIDRRVASYANLGNLSPVYKRTVINRYEHTRTGRQELEGEVLEDVEGALWSWEMIHYVDVAPDLKRIVVSVDPAGTANKKSDETGIIVLGIGFDGIIYILADHTGKYSPDGWGSKANQLYRYWSADAIVAEKNYGGDMVKSVITGTANYDGARVIEVTSRRGKALRAEPIVGLYERSKVKHVGMRGALEKLDDELTTWVPDESPSPNRIDAMVHGATNLARNLLPAEIATGANLPGARGGGVGTIPTSHGARGPLGARPFSYPNLGRGVGLGSPGRTGLPSIFRR